MIKSVEFFDAKGQVVKSVENEYAFSVQLGSVAGVAKSKGSDGIPVIETDNSAPLGIIQERSIALDYDANPADPPVKSITDLRVSKPFLIGITETVDGVKTHTRHGWFDAFTGQAMATISQNSDDSVRVELNVPLHFADDASIIERKNLYHLSKGKIVFDATGRYTAGSVLPSFSKADNDYGYVRLASSSSYTTKSYTVPGLNTYLGVPFEQSIYYPEISYQWRGTGTDFMWPAPGATNTDWQEGARVTQIDRFARVQGEKGPDGVFATAVHHPKMPVVSASVSNAKPTECAVFTGDYLASDPFGTGYWDLDNGWEKGGAGFQAGAATASVSVVDVTEGALFGNRAFQVTNSFGAVRNLKLESGQDYIFSAWVKPLGTNLITEQKMGQPGIVLAVDYRKIDPTTEEGDWPIKVKMDNAATDILPCSGTIRVKSGRDGWYQLTMKVPFKADISSAKYEDGWQYSRIIAGCPNGDGNGNSATVLLQDIRFYPKDAIVNSYYYDQDLGVPICFVDANNKAKYFEYDPFGRLVKTYNNKKQMLAEAKYNMTSPTKGALLDYPRGASPYTGNEVFWVWGQWPIEWYPYGTQYDVNGIPTDAPKVRIEYSLDGGDTWTVIPGAEATENDGKFIWKMTDYGPLYDQTYNMNPSDECFVRLIPLDANNNALVNSISSNQQPFKIKIHRSMIRNQGIFY